MPIIVDSSRPQPPPPTEMVSTDGKLTATLDVAHAGVRLTYRGDSSVQRVLFVRDGGIPIRSGDVAQAPGGMAVAYDGEAPLGSIVTYQAIISDDDADTSVVPIQTEAPAGGVDAPGTWLKSIVNPALSMAVLVQSYGDRTVGTRVNQTNLAASAYPIAITEPSLAPTFTLTILSRSQRDMNRLAVLVGLPDAVPLTDPAPVLFLQSSPTHQRPDAYVVVAKATVSSGEHPQDPYRTIALDMVTVARPNPAGAPLRIPGRTYSTVRSNYPTYRKLGDSVDNYFALIVGVQ